MSRKNNWDECLKKVNQAVPIVEKSKRECLSEPSPRARLIELETTGGLPSESEISSIIAEAKDQKNESLSNLLETLETIKNKIQPKFTNQLKVVFNDCTEHPTEHSRYAIVERVPGLVGFYQRLTGIPGKGVFAISPGFCGQAIGKKGVHCTIFDDRAYSAVKEHIDRYAKLWEATDIDLGLLY